MTSGTAQGSTAHRESKTKRRKWDEKRKTNTKWWNVNSEHEYMNAAGVYVKRAVCHFVHDKSMNDSLGMRANSTFCMYNFCVEFVMVWLKTEINQAPSYTHVIVLIYTYGLYTVQCTAYIYQSVWYTLTSRFYYLSPCA